MEENVDGDFSVGWTGGLKVMCKTSTGPCKGSRRRCEAVSSKEAMRYLKIMYSTQLSADIE